MNEETELTESSLEKAREWYTGGPPERRIALFSYQIETRPQSPEDMIVVRRMQERQRETLAILESL